MRLLKLFGRRDATSGNGPCGSAPDACCTVPTDPERDHYTADFLGATGVITIIDADLTPPKVAELQHSLLELLNTREGTRNLVVDLQNVEYLDSSCLYMLMHLLGLVKAAGGKIAVASARHAVEGLFKLTRLDQVFPIRRSVLDAIAAVEH